MDNNNQQPLEPESLEKENLNALDQLSSQASQSSESTPPPTEGAAKKSGLFRRFWSVFNIYLLIFFILVVVVAAVLIVMYINSQKEPDIPISALQDLTQEQLTEISTGSDTTVGDARYILNIQSDAIFAGNALVRGDLNVAGRVQLGQGLTIPSLTVSGTSNLSSVQVNSLNVATNTVMQGNVTINGELQVARAATFSGPISTPQLTTSNLVLGGNGSLTLNNHLKTGGATPRRSNGNALGAGGTASNTGNDTAGTVTINTGNNPPVGCFVTLTFIQAFDGNPRVQLTPTTAAAGRADYYVTRSSTNFSICSATNPAAGQNLQFDYFIAN